MLSSLLDPAGYVPRWSAGEGWTSEPWLGWTLIGADVAIWAAFTGIAFILLYTVQRTAPLKERRMLWLFATFILACGLVHLMDAITFWHPVYHLSAIAKLVTAFVSWGAAMALVRFLPKILAYRSPEELEQEVAARTRELVPFAWR